MEGEVRRQALARVEETADGGDTRVRILDAAILCFTQFGNDKTTLNDVARVAGLARQTIYRYFSDRRALLEAVQELEDGRLRAKVAVIAESAPTLESFLQGLVEARVATRSRYRTRQHLLELDRGLVHSLFLSREHTLSLIRELIAPQLEAAGRRGELVDGLDLDQAAEWIAITLTTLGTLTTSTSFDLDDPTEVGRFYARHICRGLVTRAPATGA